MTSLEAADRIGARLCRDALWHAGRCTWLSDSQLSDGRIVHGPIGPDIYTGTAGIALFLHALAGETGEEIFARTAAAALAQSLATRDRIRPALRAGFYCGWPGMAWVRAQVRQEEVIDDGPLGEEHDLIGGSAGAVAAFCALGRVDLALRHAEHLLTQACPSDEGLSWPSPRHPGRRHLTGLSHGTAGIGWALLELGVAAGERRFVDLAKEAFRYERAHYDSGQANWPDFRHAPPTFPRLWCHGAGGIAFSRLRAFQLLGDSVFREEAAIALSTMKSQPPNFADCSPCHGAAGHGDLFLYAGDLGAAVSLAETAVQRFEAQRLLWPGGISGRETPGFMLGLAGIGYFLLRVTNPAKHPTVLLPYGTQYQ
ncbi:MAG: hypothetical protein K2X03_00045 [Bryobacteraceae bacterium]|nr:hypothetical protein [Bryobacteraceae bacterium]